MLMLIVIGFAIVIKLLNLNTSHVNVNLWEDVKDGPCI